MEAKKNWNLDAGRWVGKWVEMEAWQVGERLDFVYMLHNGFVFDLGCGSGKDMGFFEQNGLECVGLDFSLKMLEHAISPIVCGEMCSLPFQDNMFDGAWSCSALKYLNPSQLKTCLLEVRRILKPNGLFWMGINEGEGEVTEIRNDLPFKMYLYRDETIIPLIKELGFELCKQETVQAWRIFNNYVLKAVK